MSILIGTDEILTLFQNREIRNAEISKNITGASILNNPKNNTVLFIKKYAEENLEIIEKLENCCIFLHTSYKGKTKTKSNVFVFGDNSRLDFALVLQTFFSAPKEIKHGIAKTATIGRNVVLGNEVAIGEYSIIGNNVVIGDRTEIHHHVVVNTGSRIGADCRIKSNTIIGEEGFGFERDEQGIPIRIPHIAGVSIGNNVEIGSLCSVGRGTIENTIIGDNTKTDTHVHIGHNVRIGKNCTITACCEISGSVQIGDNCNFGPNCSIMNNICIGEHCFIGLGTVVTKSLPQNVVAAGSPARVLRENI